MKSCFFLILLFLICSCGSNQTASTNKQSSNTTAINNKDCSSQALFYVESKYPLNGQREGEPRRSKDGNSYSVKLSKMHPMDRNLKIYSSYTVVVDENCKAISSKKSNSKF